jgi:Zn-dependent protease/CBS domain-containing protein
MPGSFRLGKLAGITVSVHLSWFIILVLLTWSLARDWFPQFFAGWSIGMYWLAAFISTLLLFLGVLVHEMAHAQVARSYGLTVKGITLFVFGGVADIEEEVKRPGIEFQIALAGPLASLVLAGVAFFLALPFRESRAPTEAILEYLAVSNLMIGIFNLIPGFPLDGGRILRSLIWKRTGNFQKATRIASFVGQACGYVFILVGVLTFFWGDFFDGLWLAFIGWFLLSAAQTTHADVLLRSTLQGVTVGQVMDTHPITVPANISVQKLLDEYFLPHRLSAAPVTQGEYLSGLITLSDLARVERERWSSIPVGHVMRLVEQIAVATPEQPLQEVLREMVARNINQVPVILDGRLVGLLSRESIVRYLQVRQSLQGEKQSVAV